MEFELGKLSRSIYDPPSWWLFIARNAAADYTNKEITLNAAMEVISNETHWQNIAKLDWSSYTSLQKFTDFLIHTLGQDEVDLIRSSLIRIKIAMRTIYPAWEISSRSLIQLIALGQKMHRHYGVSTEKDLQAILQPVDLEVVLRV
jgi:hypothetical protein